jgi:hypothetical protein
VLSHVTADFDPSTSAAATDVYKRTANPIKPRPVARIGELLAGTELVEPGLVDASLWHPDASTGPEHVGFVAGVGILR